MSRRTRILAFGSAAIAVIAGGLAFAFGHGALGAQVAGILLITYGLGAALLLSFYEVGVSDDRDHANERKPPNSARRSREDA